MEILEFLFDNRPVLSLLRQQPVLTLFLMLGLGYVIGNIRIGSFSLGPVAGVLFVGLFLGHHGFQSSPGAMSVGFALFIFSVGYQAGPRFFDVLMTDGLRYLALAVVIAATGLGVALFFAKYLELAPGTSAGLLAGGLTSSPTLAAAQEAIRAGSIAPPAGWTADQVVGNISTGYAITYIFGLAGLITIIKFMPGALGVDLEAEARSIERASGDDARVSSQILTRTYRITNEAVTRMTVAEMREKYWDGFSVVTLRRNGERIELAPEEHIRIGDEVTVVGQLEFFTEVVQSMGEEIPNPEGEAETETADVVVINPAIVGCTLQDLDLAHEYGIVVAEVRRMRMPIAASLNFELRKGDILHVSGPPANIDRFGEAAGHVEREVEETDMITFSLGIAVGVLIGLISVQVAGFSLGLGSAGGLLAAGLIVGFLRSVRPTFGRLPDAARWIFMEFGLLLFMAGVGLRAGSDIVEVFLEAGPKLVVAGVFVTATPVAVGYLFGRKVLGLNPVILLGGITGAMTSGASLSVITSTAKSAVPALGYTAALGYTGSYAFANVLLTIAGSIILVL
jgi:putative transport protein